MDWSVKQDPLIQRAAVKLMEVRERRVHPLSTLPALVEDRRLWSMLMFATHTEDDKQLTFWNGLMIFSMALAANTLGSSGYLVSAQRAGAYHLQRAMNSC